MTVENLNITVKTNADKAAPKLESLASAIDKLEVSVSKMAGLSNLANLASAVAQLSTSKVSVSIFNSMAKGIERLSEALATITEGDIVNLTMISDALAKLNGVNLSGVAGAARVVGKETNKAANGIKEVGDAAKKSEKPLGNFLSSLKRIAFYRIIRGIIKSITQAFQEGLEKAYLFSAAASDVMDRRFAAAMDSMKSSANAMKVQLGSAFIALLTTLEPIINKIIDLVIKVADVISQVFAAFTGTTFIIPIKFSAQAPLAISSVSSTTPRPPRLRPLLPIRWPVWSRVTFPQSSIWSRWKLIRWQIPTWCLRRIRPIPLRAWLSIRTDPLSLRSQCPELRQLKLTWRSPRKQRSAA